MKNTEPRQNKSQLSATLGLSRTTITAQLRNYDAPRPDSAGCYSVADVRRYIEANSPRAWERMAEREQPYPNADYYHCTFIAPAFQDDFAKKLVGKTEKQIRYAFWKRLSGCLAAVHARWGDPWERGQSSHR